VIEHRKPAVHVQDSLQPFLALCGRRWDLCERGGEPASDTVPPAVRDDRGSVNQATCRDCCAVFQRRLRAKK
jgi:hypothetical protein